MVERGGVWAGNGDSHILRSGTGTGERVWWEGGGLRMRLGDFGGRRVGDG